MRWMVALGAALASGVWAQEADEAPSSTGRAQPTVTYASHAAEILNRRCVTCHQPGGIGPFSLATYRDAASRRAMIREVITTGRMPPWHADPRYGRFKNDRRFTEQEYYTLLAWLDADAPVGTGAPPPPPVLRTGWAMGRPDAVITMPETATIPATGVMPYQYYETPTGLAQDQWVSAVEVRPGNSKVVHHILVYMRDPANSGAAGFGLGGNLLDGYAPGDEPLVFAPDVAIRIPAGARLVWQLHYTPTGKPETDRSQLGLKFATQAPRYVHETGTALNRSFVIPAHSPSYLVRAQFTFPRDAWITSLRPHMHLRGKSFMFEIRYPNGGRQILLNVPQYDFNWQNAYVLDQPVSAPRGTTLHCVATFDNSPGNAHNPNPAAAVAWGDQTWEEMMIGWFTFVTAGG